VIAGSRSEEHALFTAQLIASKLNSSMARLDLRVINLKVQNIVCSCDLGYPLNLYALAEYESTECRFDPQLFEGCHYRILNEKEKLKAGLMLFSSGKVVATGLKSHQQIGKIQDILSRFKKYHLGKEDLPEHVLKATEENAHRFDKNRERDLRFKTEPRAPVEDVGLMQERIRQHELRMAARDIPLGPYLLNANNKDEDDDEGEDQYVEQICHLFYSKFLIETLREEREQRQQQQQ
jgi:Transcription factor TFIID (or TATA-binding protein, TBP)